MDWRLKAHAMAVLSRVPAGKRVYHRAQRLLGTNTAQPAENVARAAEIVEMIREAGGDPAGKVFLEIGTGWRPFIPFVLYLLGAERILTWDVNPWLTEGYAFETCRVLAGQLSAISERLKIDEREIRRRYEQASDRANSLDDLLANFHVEYRCPGDARHTGLPGGSIDCVFSSNVLEHLPPDVLDGIHREALRVLKPGGLTVHRFNPQDHFAAVDKSITGANFLKYSQRRWNWLGGSGLSYHNRLRCVEHKERFERAGFATVVDRVRVDRRAIAEIESGRLHVHAGFARFSPAQLAADYMWYAGRTPLLPDRIC
jgi:SAM-dependent methyltransferase